MFTLDLAIYELTAFLIVIPLGYFISRIVKLIRRNIHEDDIRMLFNLYWNGKAEDELYAWYKVRHILLQRGDKKQKLRFVERKIDEINKKSLCGKMSVTESGKLLDEAPNTKII
jgi:hypothetical protein